MVPGLHLDGTQLQGEAIFGPATARTPSGRIRPDDPPPWVRGTGAARPMRCWPRRGKAGPGPGIYPLLYGEHGASASDATDAHQRLTAVIHSTSGTTQPTLLWWPGRRTSHQFQRRRRVMPTTADRLLVHGPRLGDFTDLLYFDKIACPVTMALVRPNA